MKKTGKVWKNTGKVWKNTVNAYTRTQRKIDKDGSKRKAQYFSTKIQLFSVLWGPAI